MANQKEPKGLAFYEHIAALVCSEHEFAHSWTRLEDVYVLHVQCGPHDFAFQIEREVLDDPGSEEYRQVAEKILTTLVEEVRPEEKSA